MSIIVAIVVLDNFVIATTAWTVVALDISSIVHSFPYGDFNH